MGGIFRMWNSHPDICNRTQLRDVLSQEAKGCACNTPRIVTIHLQCFNLESACRINAKLWDIEVVT